MKKANKSFKVIVDTNIWISFLIGKNLKNLQEYIDSQTVLIVTCNEQIQELTEVFKKPKIKKYFTRWCGFVIRTPAPRAGKQNADIA